MKRERTSSDIQWANYLAHSQGYYSYPPGFRLPVSIFTKWMHIKNQIRLLIYEILSNKSSSSFSPSPAKIKDAETMFLFLWATGFKMLVFRTCIFISYLLFRPAAFLTGRVFGTAKIRTVLLVHSACEINHLNLLISFLKFVICSILGSYYKLYDSKKPEYQILGVPCLLYYRG